MAGIEVTAHRVVDVLERLGVRYAITGMLAGGVHGHPRQTFDVDVSVAVVSDEEWEGILKALGKEGFKSGRRPDIHKLGAALLESPDGWGVDVFIEDDAEVFERALEINYFKKPVLFVTLEDLIRHKLRMGRMKDVPDLIALLSKNEKRIDWDYLDRKLSDAEGEELDKLRRVARGELEATAVFGRRSGNRGH